MAKGEMFCRDAMFYVPIIEVFVQLLPFAFYLYFFAFQLF
jgi:hypothetical protein